MNSPTLTQKSFMQSIAVDIGNAEAYLQKLNFIKAGSSIIKKYPAISGITLIATTLLTGIAFYINSGKKAAKLNLKDKAIEIKTKQAAKAAKDITRLSALVQKYGKEIKTLKQNSEQLKATITSLHEKTEATCANIEKEVKQKNLLISLQEEALAEKREQLEKTKIFLQDLKNVMVEGQAEQNLDHTAELLTVKAEFEAKMELTQNALEKAQRQLAELEVALADSLDGLEFEGDLSEIRAEVEARPLEDRIKFKNEYIRLLENEVDDLRNHLEALKDDNQIMRGHAITTPVKHKTNTMFNTPKAPAIVKKLMRMTSPAREPFNLDAAFKPNAELPRTPEKTAHPFSFNQLGKEAIESFYLSTPIKKQTAEDREKIWATFNREHEHLRSGFNGPPPQRMSDAEWKRLNEGYSPGQIGTPPHSFENSKMSFFSEDGSNSDSSDSDNGSEYFEVGSFFD